MTRNAPFDVARYFAAIPPSENAAPQYLDALYEFEPQEMERFMPPSAIESRGAELKERYARSEKYARDVRTQLVARNAADRAAIVAEYRESYEKLARAQERKRCIFDCDLAYRVDSKVPHAVAARRAVRLLDWRVEAEIAEGRIDAALADVEMALRLSRDLRPRGPIFCQWASITIDNRVLHYDVVPRILRDSRLKTGDCGRLIEIIAHHMRESERLDSPSEGFRAEYLMLRHLLHRLELREQLGPSIGVPAASNGLLIARRFTQTPDRVLAASINETLDRMTAADFAAEIDALNQFFAPIVKPANRAFRQRAVRGNEELLPEQQRAVEKLKVMRELLHVPARWVEACSRDQTIAGATLCLAALRRWQLERGVESPPDLLSVCKAAGIRSVPVDPFDDSDAPLRFATINDEFVIYSVGRDGVDDMARLEWKLGENAVGDWIFRLPPMSEPDDR
jgi:hypothetical protein